MERMGTRIGTVSMNVGSAGAQRLLHLVKIRRYQEQNGCFAKVILLLGTKSNVIFQSVAMRAAEM
jgi:2-iminoacetate synthase ThiH